MRRTLALIGRHLPGALPNGVGVVFGLLHLPAAVLDMLFDPRLSLEADG